MSSVIPVPPTPTKAPMWVTILGWVLTALFAGFSAHPLIIPPVPPTPAPTPIPTPAPAPTAAIVIKDAKGNPISGDVEDAQLFTASSPEGTSITAAGDGQAIQTAPNQIVCSLASGNVLHVIVYDSGKFVKADIRCKAEAPQPQPTPPTPPIPAPQPLPPTPQPTPPTPIVSNQVSMSIVEDAANRTPATAATMNAQALWNGFRAKGGEVHVYDKSDPTLPAITAISTAKAQNVPLPALVITNKITGALLKVMPLPPSDQLQSVLSTYGG